MPHVFRIRRSAAVGLLSLLSATRARADAAGASPKTDEAFTVAVTSTHPTTLLYRIQSRGTGGGPVFVSGSGVGFAVVGMVQYETICRAPCTAQIARGEYFVGGDGVVPSKPFYLETATSLDVKAGSPGLRILGAVGMSTGVLAALTGATLAIVPVAAQWDADRRDTVVPVGYGLLASGLLVTGLGIWAVLASQTTVRDASGATMGKASPGLVSF